MWRADAARRLSVRPRGSGGDIWTFRTPRLRIRPPAPGDSDFLVRLLNDPAFLRFIGDRGVRTRSDARLFLEDSLLRSFRRYGFGPCVLTAAVHDEPLGLCGIYQRDSLRVPDIGYALLPGARGRGLAREAARAVLVRARSRCHVDCIVGLVGPENVDSARVLTSCAMRRAATIENPAGKVSDLYAPADRAARPGDLVCGDVRIIDAAGPDHDP